MGNRTILLQADDVLYEIVEDQVVELAPMGAYEVWIATLLVTRLATFASSTNWAEPCRKCCLI